MARVITFSTKFPSYHPRKGDTNFLEKVLISLYPNNTYYMVKCENCHWQGMSCACEGGGAIADTGDFSDPLCPKCFSNKLDGDCDDLGYYKEDENNWPKHHTIRAGNRWKVGDKFSPRVWSAKPYASPQITIAPDVEIKKLWDIRIFKSGDVNIRLKTETGSISYWCSIDSPGFKKLAENDGLSVSDMAAWFKMPCTFKGQIICWNDSIQY